MVPYHIDQQVGQLQDKINALITFIINRLQSSRKYWGFTKFKMFPVTEIWIQYKKVSEELSLKLNHRSTFIALNTCVQFTVQIDIITKWFKYIPLHVNPSLSSRKP